MMKERILQIMKRENMTQQEFAKAIDVSPASLSNIFNGKTNPTNNHVTAIHRRFPDININWLMFGEGDMYATVSAETNNQECELSGKVDERLPGTKPEAPTLFSHIEHAGTVACPNSSKEDENEGGGSGKSVVPVVREVIKYVDKPQRKITEIRIFFDDGTFEAFS